MKSPQYPQYPQYPQTPKNPLRPACIVLGLALCGPAAAQQAAGPAAQQAGGTEQPVATEAAPDARPLEVTMLRLRNGSIQWGSIVEHDPDGFRFTLLSHGGLVDVPWSLLDPNQERELRERFGYVDVSSEEFMIEVERLLLVDGNEVNGVVLSREGENFVVKVDGNLQMVPKRRVQNILKGHRVPALDVYGREELYGMFLGETAEDDPDAQVELAKRCELILDFAHAVTHYERCLVLDPEGERPEVEFALERARRKAESQAQIDYLRSTDQLRKRGRFDEALALLEAFDQTFPDSPLVNDARIKTTRVLTARDDAIRDLVRRQWMYWMKRLTRMKAGELDYAGALAYAEEGLSEEIQERVLKDVRSRISESVEPDQILAFWATRVKVRYQRASYGLGTWLLGEDKARAGTEDKEAALAALSDMDKQRATLEKKIKRFLENQQAARRARARQEQEDELEAFWRGFSTSGRAAWMLAHYVEFSGDLELRDHPYLSNCSSCAGRGVHEVIHVGGGAKGSGGVSLVPCPLCRGVGVVRRVFYR